MIAQSQKKKQRIRTIFALKALKLRIRSMFRNEIMYCKLISKKSFDLIECLFTVSLLITLCCIFFFFVFLSKNQFILRHIVEQKAVTNYLIMHSQIVYSFCFIFHILLLKRKEKN